MVEQQSEQPAVEAEPYQHIVTARVTAEQYMRLVLAARDGGHRSLSACIRALADGLGLARAE